MLGWREGEPWPRWSSDLAGDAWKDEDGSPLRQWKFPRAQSVLYEDTE